MKKPVRLAIVGATGAVGEAMLDILQQRKFPIAELFLLASERSAGTPIDFNGKSYLVQDLSTFDFSKADIALFSAGGAISAEYAPKAAAAGCVAIDNTSHFRNDPEIPLIVPEVNPEAIKTYKKHNIISNPNCSTIQMVVALKPIYDAVGITRINVATYQAVSGAGRSAVKELVHESAQLLNGRPIKPEVFPQQIAFNVLPHIDVFEDNGYTKEEMKMVRETQKILQDSNIVVNPTAVRVPVFYGHSEALHIETRDKISADDVTKLLKKAPGVKLMNTKKHPYPTPFSNASGKDEVFVGRIREDISHPKGINLWVVSDNLRKGAALNTIQIAELLLDSQL